MKRILSSTFGSLVAVVIGVACAAPAPNHDPAMRGAHDGHDAGARHAGHDAMSNDAPHAMSDSECAAHLGAFLRETAVARYASIQSTWTRRQKLTHIIGPMLDKTPGATDVGYGGVLRAPTSDGTFERVTASCGAPAISIPSLLNVPPLDAEGDLFFYQPTLIDTCTGNVYQADAYVSEKNVYGPIVPPGGVKCTGVANPRAFAAALQEAVAK